MEKKLATLLKTTSNVLVFKELLMAQGDIWSIGNTMDILLVEFDQHAFEEYLSLGSKTPTASRPLKMVGIESHAYALLSPTKVGKSNASPKVSESFCSKL